MRHEFEVETCAHRVKCWVEWDGRRVKTTDALISNIEQEAEDRTHEMIAGDGYIAGELNCTEHEIRGWWAIEREAPLAP